MSWQPSTEPGAGAPSCPGLELTIVPRSHDLGGFEVRRALPSARRRMVGPFVFFDQMGPATFAPGRGIDVRPHPHIGLATLTYLFEGEILHRDSVGSVQPIRPGDVNWMTAGRGIVHSERTPGGLRETGGPAFGIQSWIALPKAHEETAPAFVHHGKAQLPVIEDGGVTVRLIVGTLFGARSPVATFSDMVYADATLAAGATLPFPPGHEERAVYLAQGAIEIAGDRFDEPQLLVFRPGDSIAIEAVAESRLMLLGGEAMDGPRHIWWNFVSSSAERIEQAKADWREGRFAAVPGETEFIPLPE
ncbi:MAG TPA: pirin family protein [Alphaproteobacteria bacterium]